MSSRLQCVCSKVTVPYTGEPLSMQVYTEKTQSLNKVQLQKKLMSFDLRFDTLSEYLSNFSQVINQHATLLGHLQDESLKKATKKELSGCLKKSADTFEIPNAEFNQMIFLQIKDSRPLLPNDTLAEKVRSTSNHLANRVDQMKTAFSLLFNQNKELFDRLEKAEQGIRNLRDTKTDQVYTEEKVDQLYSEIYKRTDAVQIVCLC